MAIIFLENGKNVNIPWKMKPIEKIESDKWLAGTASETEKERLKVDLEQSMNITSEIIDNIMKN